MLIFAMALLAGDVSGRTLAIESTLLSGVSVTSSPADDLGRTGGTTNLALTYPDAAEVTLTAPNAVGRYRFLKWLKDGEAYESGLTTRVTMDADHTLMAVYAEVFPTFPTNLQIMPLGDSITQGYNGGNAGYRGPLYSLLNPLVTNFRYLGTSLERPGNLPLTPINQRSHEGHSSYNLQDISNNLDGFDNTRFLLIGGPDRNPAGGYWLTGGNGTGRAPVFPDVITLMAGTNDLQIMPGVEERLVGLLTKLTTLRPDTKLLIARITPIPHLTEDEDYNLMLTRVVGDFQAAGKNLHLVDQNTGFPANGLDPDGVHPNNVGFNWMASQWFEAIVAAYSPAAVQRPFRTEPVPLPGRIEAEDFDHGGQGIAYRDLGAGNEGAQYRPAEGVDIETTDDADGGYQVFQAEAGEWLEYSVKVDSAGRYTPSLRVATPSDGAEVFLEIDGVNATNNLLLPNTGGEWETVAIPDIHLGVGEHVLRLVIAATPPGGSLGSFNWMSLEVSSQDGPLAQAGTDIATMDQNSNGSETVTLNASGTTAGDSPALDYTWWRGGTQIASGLTASVDLPVGVQVIQLRVTDGNNLTDTDELLVTVAPKTLINGSFESGFNGWAVSGSLNIQSAAPYSPTNGVMLAGFNGGNQPANGILSQSFATAPGGTYTLEFDAGALSYNLDTQTLRVTATGLNNLLTQTISISGPNGGANRWLPQSFTFVANSQTSSISFRDLSGPTIGIDLLLDNVRVTGPPAYPTNNPPVAVGESFVTSENIRLVVPAGGLLANDNDPDGNSLVAIANVLPKHGTLVLNLNGGFTYTPANGYFGPDSFTYQINDQFLNSNIVTVGLMVNEVIPPPVAAGDLYSTDENMTLAVPAGGVLTNDGDPRSRPLTAVTDTLPAHGDLEFNADGSFIFTPDPGYYGVDSFTYHCRNGFLNSNIVTVNLVIREVIPPPVALPDSYVTDENIPLLVPAGGVLSNDSDPRSRAITAVLDVEPGHGTVELDPDGGFTYTPEESYFGPDSFSYHANNGFLDSEPVVVSLFINEVVPPPAATADSYSTNENVPLSVPANGVLANDSDPRNRPISALVTSQPAHGTLVLNPNGGFIFTPAVGYYGTDSFTYRANNGFLDSGNTTVTLTINEVIPPPAAVADAFVTDENVPLVIPASGVLANDFDPRGRPLTATLAVDPSNGTLVFDPDGGFTYTPAPGFYGNDSFAYFARNGFLNSNIVTVYLTVNEVVPAPSASEDFHSTDENTPLSVPAEGVLANDSDPRGRPLTAVLETQPGHGNVALGSDGGFVFTPAPGYYGPDSFTYRANNGFLNSEAVTVFLFVNEVIPPPVAVEDAFVTDENIPLVIPAAGVLANDSDPRGRPLTAQLAVDPSNGTLVFDPNGGFSYTPAPGFYGIDSFAYSARNGFLNSNIVTVYLTVNEVVPAPSATEDFHSTDENTPLSVPADGVLANDSDPRGRPLTAVLETQPGHGNVALGSDGGFVFTPAPGYYGPDSFTYRANNGFLDSEAVTVFLFVNEVIPPPAAVADAFVTDENIPLVIPAAGVLANDSDPRGRTLTAQLAVDPSNGTLVFDPNGGFTYTPAPGFYGNDSFAYFARNGFLSSNIVTVNLTVNEVVPAPSASEDFHSTDENTPLSVPADGVLANDSDPRGRPLTALLETQPGHGNVALGSDGGFVFTPAPGYYGPDSFTYRANNGFLNSEAVTVFLFVNEVIPPPVAVADSYETLENVPLVITAGGVLGNDSDPRSRPLTATLAVDPSNGTLVFDPDGGFTYSPNPGYFGTDSFKYFAKNGFLESDLVTVTLTINEAVPPPAAVAESYTTHEGVPLSIAPNGVLANDSDPRGRNLSAALATQAVHGNVILNANGSFTYTPALGFYGTDSFSYRANNGFLNSNTVTVGLTVIEVIPTPVAVADSFVATESTPLVVPADGVLANDFDPRSRPLTALIESGPGHGTVTLNPNGSFSYIPAANYFGPDSFTYRALNGTLNSNVATVNLTVQELVPPPVAVADNYTTLRGTALTVPAAGVLANDSDPRARALTAVLVSGPGQGTLSLSANGSFTYAPAIGFSGSDTFTYQARNGFANSPTVTVTINVAGINFVGPVNGSFESGFANWTVSGSAAIQSSAPYVPSNGTKLVGFNGANATSSAVLSQSFDTAPGDTYTLTFDLGVLSYNTNSQSMRVEVSGNGNLLTRTVGIDGLGGGSNRWLPQSFTFVANSFLTTLTFRDQSTTTLNLDMTLDNVRVTGPPTVPSNTAPVAVADSYSTNQNTALVVPASGVLGNDTDAQSQPLTATIGSPPYNGTVTLNANGGFTYTPSNGFSGTDSFTYRANDGTLNSNVATVSLTIVSNNTAPVAVADSYSTNQNTALVVPASGVLINDTDAQSQPLTALLVSGPASGALVLNPSGGFTYTPNTGFSGSDAFTYKASDGSLDSNVVTVSLAVAAPVAVGLINGSFESDFTGWTATGVQHIQSTAPYSATAGSKLIGFNGADRTPNAVLSQSFATTAGTTYTLTFDLGVLAYTTNAQTMQVSVTGTGNLLVRTLTVYGVGGGINFWAPQSFTFVANSPLTTLRFADQSTSTLGLDMTLDNVKITGPPIVVNTAPVAGSDSYSINQDTALVVPTPGVLANDRDAQLQSLTAIPGSGPAHGSLTLNANGSFTYTPAAGYSGPDLFTYRASDGSLTSSLATVSLNVIAILPPPVANDDTYSTSEGTTLTVEASGLLANDSDPGSLPLTAVLDASPRHGTVTLNSDGSFSYTPATGYFGADSFTYHANNGGADSGIATVNLTINEVVPPPLAVGDTYTTSVDTALIVPATGVLANDSDPRSRPLTAVLDSGPGHGSLTLSPNGNFTYTPATGYSGSDSFSYHARNGVLDSNVVTVSISISPVVTGTLVNGSFESNFTGWTISGNLAIQSGAPYAASDGAKLVGFNGANLTPNAVLSQTFATAPGQTYTLAFDAGILSYISATQTVQVIVNGTGNLLTRVITLSANGSGSTVWTPQSFTFVANSASSTLTFRDQSTSSQGLDLVLDNVRISGGTTPPNTAPVAAGESYSTNQDSTLTITSPGVLANDTDAQSQPLTAVLDASPANGSLSLNSNGGFTYMPNNGYSGPDSFTYHARDGFLNSNIVTVSLTVNSTNTAPVAVPDSYSTNLNTSLSVPAPGVLSNDTDAQSQPLIATVSSGPANGSLTLNPNGGFTYTPNNGFSGTDSFTYRANDGALNSAVATVGLTVVAPVVVGLVNGSFESNFSGWTISGSQTIQSNAPYVATQGTKLVGFNGGNQTPNAVLSQTFATSPGQTCTLAFDVGVFSYNTNSQTLQVAVTGTGNLLTRTINILGAGGGTLRWFPQSFTFTANSDSTTLTFRDQSTSTIALDMTLDNVRVSAAQPSASALIVSSAVEPEPLGPLKLTGTPGDFTIRMTATLPGTYVLERSEDLSIWKRIKEMTVLAPGGIEFRDTRDPFDETPPEPRMFYRIGRLPSAGED